MLKKTYTVRVHVEEGADVDWLHDTMKTGKPHNGLTVTAISSGDLFGVLEASEGEANLLNAVGHSLLSEEEQDKMEEFEAQTNACYELMQEVPCLQQKQQAT